MSDENGTEPQLTKKQLRAENKVLTTWVIGLVTDCEGCISEAKAWVEKLGAIDTNYERKSHG